MTEKLPSPLTQSYSDRKLLLKHQRTIANRFLEENKALKTKKTKSWESERIENNILQLKEIIASLNKQMTDKAVRDYVQNSIADLINRKVYDRRTEHRLIKAVKENHLLFEMARFSVSYSINNDFYWVKEGTVKDHFEIALGMQQPEDFEKYCDEKIAFIRESVIPHFRSETKFNCDLLISILDLFDQQPYQNTNILLMVFVEGLTREICSLTYAKQNPNLSLEEARAHIATKQSIENVITKTNWKNDIPIELYRAVHLSTFIDDPQLIAANNLYTARKQAMHSAKIQSDRVMKILQDENLTDDQKKAEGLAITKKVVSIMERFKEPDRDDIHVSIKVELQFLIRRFKDDRNAIIHGDYSSFNKKWKSYIYFSAVVELYRLKIKLGNLYDPVPRSG